MGEVAQRLADHVVLTDDNPRSESSAQIIDGILEGMVRNEQVHVVRDRAQAIAQTIAAADVDDLVLVAGKGHEDYQEINGVRQPFSDIEQVKAAMQGGDS